MSVREKFEFEYVNEDNIIQEINNLDKNKSGTFGNIPSDRLKEVSEVSAPCLTNIWNFEIINQHTFPDNLKIADVTPVYKTNFYQTFYVGTERDLILKQLWFQC